MKNHEKKVEQEKKLEEQLEQQKYLKFRHDMFMRVEKVLLMSEKELLNFVEESKKEKERKDKIIYRTNMSK